MPMTLAEMRERNAAKRKKLPVGIIPPVVVAEPITPADAAFVLAAAAEGKVPATEMDLPVTQYRPNDPRAQRPVSRWVAHPVPGSTVHCDPRTFAVTTVPTGRWPMLSALKLASISKGEAKRLREDSYATDHARVLRERKPSDGSDTQRTWRDCGFWYPMQEAKELRARRSGKLETTRDASTRVLAEAESQLDYAVWCALVGRKPQTESAYELRRRIARRIANEQRESAAKREAKVTASRIKSGAYVRQGEPMRAPVKPVKPGAPIGAVTVRPNPFVSPVYVWVQGGTSLTDAAYVDTFGTGGDAHLIERARTIAQHADRETRRDWASIIDAHGTVVVAPAS